MISKSIFRIISLATLLLPLSTQAQTKLTIETWFGNDKSNWQEKIEHAFEARYPSINLTFLDSVPINYDEVIKKKLDAGKAGDLITCRPFDESLFLYEQKHLTDLSKLKAMRNFSSLAKSAWQTDDLKVTFCVPIASVIHGFIYNKDIFKKLGLKQPNTEDDFFATLDAIKEDGTYTPLAMGTKDKWEAATMGYNNIGPNYWKGEDGRIGLIIGSQKLTDSQWVEPYATLAKWAAYLGDNFSTQSYDDSQKVFLQGKAAIYPAGSWEIANFNELANFTLGAFKPPVKSADQTCYISDHTDMAMGMNASTKNPDAAKTFLEWLGTKEFAQTFSNAVPGFFSLSKFKVKIKDPLAQEFVSWRNDCQSTIRSTYQILSRGTPDLETETWAASAAAINGTATPEELGIKLQKELSNWYGPQQ